MPTTMTRVNGKWIFNSTLTRDYLCAECFGALVGRRVNGDYRVVCAANPDHREYIHKAEAHEIQTENEMVLAWWAATRTDEDPVLRPLGLDDDFEGFD
jgi:hypothetical protein